MCKNLRKKPFQTFSARVTTFLTKFFVKNPDHYTTFFCRQIYYYFHIRELGL